MAKKIFIDCDPGQDDFLVLAALYENGRMVSTEKLYDAVYFDENGIASLYSTIGWDGSADTAKVFILSKDGTMIPCTENVEIDLTEQNRL